MKHIQLSDGTILRSERQVAEQFLIVHKEHADKGDDLKAMKAFVKTNPWEWAMHGLKVTPKKGDLRLDATKAKALFIELGATEDQIAACYKRTKPSIAVGKA